MRGMFAALMLRECSPGGTRAAAGVRAGKRGTQWMMNGVRMPCGGPRGGGGCVGMTRMSRRMMLTGRLVALARFIALARFMMWARSLVRCAVRRGLDLVGAERIACRGDRPLDQLFNRAKVAHFVPITK